MATSESSSNHVVKSLAHSPGPMTDDDLRFQRRQWRAERIGWAAMVVILIGAMAGAFGGSGPLASTVATTADGSQVRYARFARLSAPTKIDISVSAPPSGRHIRLRVSESYVDVMALQAIIPPPFSTTLADRQYVFAFERSSTSGAAKIQLQLEPQAIGPYQGWLAVDDGAPIRLSHFIYP